jgi:adenylyl-sulfate kinase
MTNIPLKTTLTQQDREQLKGHVAKVIWLTGLSGAGKSTIASALEIKLHETGKHAYILDSDYVRQGLNKDLDFHPQNRSENIRRIAEVALMMKQAGLIVIVTCIAPFHQDRDKAKELIGHSDFIEVYVSTPLAICIERDPKGLYKKSQSGQLALMTGIDSPYEAPEHPNLVIDASSCPVSNSVEKIIELLRDNPKFLS